MYYFLSHLAFTICDCRKNSKSPQIVNNDSSTNSSIRMSLNIMWLKEL